MGHEGLLLNPFKRVSFLYAHLFLRLHMVFRLIAVFPVITHVLAILIPAHTCAVNLRTDFGMSVRTQAQFCTGFLEHVTEVRYYPLSVRFWHVNTPVHR